MTDTDLAAAGELAMPELRYAVAPITNVEVREPSESYDNTWTMSGYAAVFGEETTLYDGRFMRITEELDHAAFDVCLREQGIATSSGVVHFNPNHDMSRAVASTKIPAGQPGSLTLRADSKGLFYTARVSRDDPDAVAMAAKLRTGVWDQASFAFTIARSETTESEGDGGLMVSHQRIMEVGHLYDVCACPQGAYSQTVSQLRSYAAAAGHPTPEEVRVSVALPDPFDRSSEAGPDVRPDEGSVRAMRRLSAAELRGIARHTRKG